MRKWASKKVALRAITLDLHEEVQLICSFNSFGSYINVQGVCQDNDGLNDGAESPVLGCVLYEGSIDLERIHRKPSQVTKRGVACTKVVDGQFDAQLSQ